MLQTSARDGHLYPVGPPPTPAESDPTGADTALTSSSRGFRWVGTALGDRCLPVAVAIGAFFGGGTRRTASLHDPTTNLFFFLLFFFC
ncbi:hypothetical protein NL676_028900 [Syzygium grande]|nr:hypothetical protein NL676_028900 [Syzygium grande]